MKLTFFVLILFISLGITPFFIFAQTSETKSIELEMSIAYGGSNFETACDVSYYDGKYIVTGDTFSSDFPSSGNDSSHGAADFFITSVDFQNNIINWNRVLGGDRTDFSYESIIDDEGYIYLTGATDSTDFLFEESIEINQYGGLDVYILKLSSVDGSIEWLTQIGGSSNDYGFGTILDLQGNIIVSGYSISSDFNTTSGFEEIPTDSNAFLTKISPQGEMIWSRTFGGSNQDQGYMTRVDSNNNIYLIGETTSNILPNQLEDRISPNGRDLYVAKFSSEGINLWSKYIGGSGNEKVVQIEINSNDQIYVLGTTTSEDVILQNPYMEKDNPSADFLLLLLNENGIIDWSTVFGGSGVDEADAMTLTSYESVIIAGITQSSDVPLKNQIDSSRSGDIDMLIAEFTKSGDLVWSTYFGGSNSDVPKAMITTGNELVIVGHSMSNNLPALENGEIEDGEAQIVAIRFTLTDSVPRQTDSDKIPVIIHTVLVCLPILVYYTKNKSTK